MTGLGNTDRQGVRLGARVVAIAVSTGGPAALMRVLPLLPAGLEAPVLVVQHIPPDFTQVLVTSLRDSCLLRVKEAQAGELLTPGTVYIAPGGIHMEVRPAGDGSPGRGRVALNDGPPENSCKPAADVLLRSLPGVYGARVLAVVMTGMGSDGLKGVTDIKRAGGRCLTQARDDCTVYGMPRVVDEAGLSDFKVPLAHLAAAIAREVHPLQ